MTGAPAPPALLLSDKLMTFTNLTTRVPVLLDVDEMNYSSWMFFSYRGYDLLNHILGETKTTDDASSSELTPPTAKWLTIDSIVLTWIFTTLSKTLQQRLVVENPKMAKEAWDIIALISNDNKRSPSIALKAELRLMKLGDLSIDTYFCKIESIATILSSLGSPTSNDDVVNIALDGLPNKYQHVSDIIIHRDPFPDLKTVRSMLTTTEMRLKSRAQATYVDFTSSSPMVLLANSDTNTRRPAPSTENVNKPCFSFNKGLCRFGEYYKFFHNGVHGNPSSGAKTSTDMTHDDMRTLKNLLAKLRFDGNSTSTKPFGTSTVQQRNGSNQIVAFHTNNNAPLFATLNIPRGFNNPPQAQQPTQPGPPGQNGQPGQNGSGQQVPIHQPSQPTILGHAGQLPGQEMLLPNAFHVVTLPDPAPFVRDNYCTVEFDAFGFSVKEFITRRMLLRCDSTGDLYPVTKPFIIPRAFLA
ncbi:hybrid signal transduction histidine kinase M, partial [Tanacetum coccineum]